VLAGGIRTIPPGFTRGLDFGEHANDGWLEEEEDQVKVTPIYRPMLDQNNPGNITAVLVSTSVAARAKRA